MRGLVFTVCLLAIIGTTLAWPQWFHRDDPENPEDPGVAPVCEPGVEFYPHENCTLYWQCDNGRPIARACAGTLYWNPAVNNCDDPAKVPECIGGTRPPTGTSPNTPAPTPVETTAAPVETTAAPVETTAAPVETTAAPVETTAAPVETTAAPEETTVAPVETTAAPAETTAAPVETTAAPVETTAAPEETTAAQVETTAPTEQPTVCKEPGIYNLPVRGNCSAYIQCVHHVEIPKTCAPGLLFDPVLRKCNLEELVTCEEDPETTVAPPTTSSPEDPICENPDLIYNVPHPDDCSLYYLCALGEPVLLTCANGTLFDVDKLDCVLEDEAKCYEKPTTEPPVTTTTKEPFVCRPGEYYNVEVVGDCTRFILCADGVPILQSCAPKTIFDPTLAKCVREEDYLCPYTPSEPPTEPPKPTTVEPPQPSTIEPPQPTTIEPPQPSTIEPPVETTTENKYPCPPGVPLIYLPHDEDCAAFYICRNGVFGGVFYCGRELWFSTKLQGCVEPRESDCTLATKTPLIKY